MSIEDLRNSNVDGDHASHEMISDVHETAGREDAKLPEVERVELAQAQTNEQSPKTDRVEATPPAQDNGNATTGSNEVVPDQNNVAHLAADVSLDDIRIEGANLVLVQPDGTEIVIVNGAAHVPTFLLGDVELPRDTVIAALNDSHINVAAGPDGGDTASAAAPSSGADFQDTIQGNDDAPTELAALLADTQQPDGGPGSNEELRINHAPTIELMASGLYIDTQNDDEFKPIEGVVPGRDTDRNDALRYGVEGGQPLAGDPNYDIIKVGTYGELRLNSATGAYVFTPNDAAIEGLKSHQSESFTFTITDKAGASGTQVWTVDINGTNDLASISGGAAGSLVEDGKEAFVAQGQLSVSDRDVGDGSFQNPSAEAKTGHYGTFTFNAQTGAWTYTLNNASSAVQGLAAGEIVHDKLTVVSLDGTASQVIDITITGTNDAPVITTTDAGASLTEFAGQTGSETDQTASGTLSFTDVDLKDIGHTASVTSVSVAGVATGLPSNEALLALMHTGTITKADGSDKGTIAWSFGADDKTFDYLANGEKVTLSYTVQIDDGDGGKDTEVVTIVITGTNDAPVITTEGAGASLTELSGQTGSETDQTASGSLSFTDVDLSDTGHAASVTAVSVSGISAGLPSNEALLAMFQTGAVTKDAGSTTGAIAWSFAADDKTFDYLASGEKVTLSYTVQVADGNGATGTEVVTIVISGTNDVPVITTTDAGASFEELTGQTGSEADRTASGTLSFTDVDLNDTGHTASVTAVSATGVSTGLPSNEALLAFMHTGTVTKDAGSATGTIGWNFSADDKTFDYLASGETVTLSYTVQVDDGDGGTATQVVSITVTGNNDAPIIEATSVDVTEQANKTLSLSNDVAKFAIHFTDADLSDKGHTAKVTGFQALGETDGLNFISQIALRSALDINSVTKAAGSTDGQINATFKATDAIFDYLAAGETLTLRYTIQVNDKHGATVSQTVDVVVTGTNDAPHIAYSDLRFVNEQSGQTGSASPDTASGIVLFSDVDLSDAGHVATVKGVMASGALGGTSSDDYSQFLTVSAVKPAGGALGAITWSFNAPDSTFDYLAKGEKLTLTYTVLLSDGHGGTDTSKVTIVVTGSNDAPVITTTDAGALLTEFAGQTGSETDQTASGTLSFKDVDLNDKGHMASVTGVSVTGVATGLPSNEALLALMHTGTVTKAVGSDTGTIAWNFAADDKTFDYLANGEKVTLSYTVQVDDGDGGTDTEVVTIVITGTNDAPAIAAGVSAGIMEQAGKTGSLSLDTAHLTIGFTDADLSNTGHTAQVTGVTASGVTNGLLTSNLGNLVLENLLKIDSVSKAAGSAQGTVSATFKAPDLAFDYLGEGEKLTLTYTIRVNDGANGVTSQTVDVVITGTNDAPVLTTGLFGIGGSGSIIESYNTTNSNGLDTAKGTLYFADADLSDTQHTALVTNVVASGDVAGIQQGQLLGFMQTAVNNGSNNGTLIWNFAAADKTFDYLGVGDKLTLTYTIQLADGHGGFDTQAVTITVYGTNDKPVITGVSNPAAIIEAIDASHQDISAVTGTLTVADADIGDKLTGSVTGNGTAAFSGGALPNGVDISALIAKNAISFTQVASTSGHGDTLTWTYDPKAANLDWLGEGQTLTITYKAQVSDQRSTTGSQDITITITGTNDAPVIADSHATGSVVEAGLNAAGVSVGQSSVSDTLVKTDIDADDNATNDHWAILVSKQGGTSEVLNTNGKYGTFSIDQNGKWTYTLDDDRQATQELNLNQTVTETFTVQVKDSHGAIDTQQVVVTITGSNDKPVISGGETSGTVIESGIDKFGNYMAGDASESGQLKKYDVDDEDDASNDKWSVIAHGNGQAQDGTSVVGAYGSLSVDQDGKWTYNLNNSLAATQALGRGDTKVETFYVQVTDTHGATDIEVVKITVVGTNDRPVASDDSFTISESQIEDASNRNPLTVGNVLTGAGKDTDVDGDQLTVSRVSDVEVTIGNRTYDANLQRDGSYKISTANGDAYLTISENGSVKVWSDRGEDPFKQLGVNETAKITFDYQVSDGNGGKDSATATINITGTNDTPLGSRDFYKVDEDNVLKVQGSGVLKNDRDPDGDKLTAVLVSGPAHGTLTLNADGSFVYTPTKNYHGDDSFTYRPNDGITSGDPVVVKITVGSVIDHVFTDGGETRDLRDFSADQTMTSPDNPYFEDGNYLDAKGGDDTVYLPNAENELGQKYADLYAAGGTFNAGDGNDKVIGGDLNDRIDGGAGDDDISGGLGADNLSGGIGDDTFRLGADLVASGERNIELGDGTKQVIDITGYAGTMDVVQGGEGYDKIVLDSGDLTKGFAYDAYSAPSYISSVEEIDGTAKDDIILVGADYRSGAANGGILIEGGAGNDIIGGGAGDDTLRGGTGDDLISGLGGNDTIEGGDGKDTLYGGAGDDMIDGGADDDTIIGGAGADTIKGGAGNDTIIYTIGDGADVVDGGDGNDTLKISTSSAADAGYLWNYVKADGSNIVMTPVQPNGTAAPAPYNETLKVTGVETLDIALGNSNALIFGQGGGNLAAAGVTDVKVTGDDTGSALWFANVSSNTHLTANLGGGDDLFVAGGQAVSQQVDGGAGNDSFDFSQITQQIDIDLASGVAVRSTMNGVTVAQDAITNFENATGSVGNDTIRGTSGANVINGGNGDDVIEGRGGADTLSGGEGNDRITAGSELIVNGGFKGPAEVMVSGGSDAINLGGGWNVTSGSVDLLVVPGALNARFPAGVNAVDMQGVSQGTIAQTFATVAGQTYTVTFLQATNPDALTHGLTESSVTVNVGDSSQTFVDQADAGTTWQTVGGTFIERTITFTATGASTTLEFVAGGSSAYGSLIAEVSVTSNAASAGATLDGGAGNDVITGGTGNDTIDGGTGDDLIRGGAGNDTIHGGAGDDFISGGKGDDKIFGDAGNDTFSYSTGDGVDKIDGGDGHDTLHIAGSDTGSTFNINSVLIGGVNNLAVNFEAGSTANAATAGNYEVATTNVEEWVIDGGKGNDTFVVSGDLSGTGLATSTITINGGAGNDLIVLDRGANNANRVVVDGGNNSDAGDSVKLDFKYTDITHVVATVHGFEITHNGVTDIFTNIENFQFSDGVAQTYDQLVAAPAAPVLTVIDDKLPLTGDVPNGGATNDTTPTIHIALANTGALAGDSVQLYDKGVAIGGAVVLTAAAISQGYIEITTGNLPEGEHSFTAAISDLFNHTGATSDAAAITIDVTPPAASSSLDLDASDDTGNSSTDNLTKNTSGLTITGSGEKGATVTLFDDANHNGLMDGNETRWTASVGNNGKFSQDISLAEGAHDIRAIQTDAAGNASVSSGALTIKVDTTAPAAPTALSLASDDDTGSSSSDDVTKKTSNLTISGSAEKGLTVTLFDDANHNGLVDSGESQWTATVGSDGKFSKDISLSEGDHDIRAVQTDAAGNVSVASGTLGIVVDTTAPLAPAGLALAANDDTGSNSSDGITKNTSGLTITGSGEKGATVTLFDDSNHNGIADGNENQWTVTVGNDGTFSKDISLSQGVHDIRGFQTDVAGNVSAAPAPAGISITVDTSAPSAPSQLDLAANDDTGSSSTDDITKNTSALTISGSGEKGATVTIFDDANNNGAADANESKWTTAVGSDGKFTQDISLGEGVHNIRAVQTDVAGNVSGASQAHGLDITVDTTAPSAPASLALSASDDTGISSTDDITKNTSGLTISGSGEKGAVVTVFDDANHNGLADANESKWTTTVGNDGKFTQDISLSEGVHDIRAFQTDIAGNVGAASASHGLDITVDTTAPTATITIADNNLTVGETTQVTITFSEAVMGFDKNDLTVPNGTLSAVTSSDGGITWTATLTPTANTSDATNVISLAAGSVTDAAGNSNVSAQSGNYIVNTPAPVEAIGETIITNAGYNTLIIPDWVLLLNDQDASGKPLTVSDTSNPSIFTAVTHVGENVLFNNVLGGSFDYSVTNGAGGWDTAHVTVVQDYYGDLDGTNSGDILIGYGGTVNGNDGNDVLVGFGANVNLLGGKGDDILVSSPGNNSTLNGGDGNDTFVIASGSQVVNIAGGNGTDTLDLSHLNSGITASLQGGSWGSGSISSVENITGSAYSDTLTGNSGANVIIGGAGADTLIGGGGSDTFVFAAGDTAIKIGGQNQNGSISGYDKINDFDKGNDKLTLDGTPFAAANTNGIVDGTNSDLRIQGAGTEVSKHSIVDGIISFSTNNTGISIVSEKNLAAVVQYLERNDLGAAGVTVAFSASFGPNDYHTFIYQQVGDVPNAQNDILIDLVGVRQETQIQKLTTLFANNAIDPIILDLDHNGIALTSLEHGVQFDINADGHKDQIAWTAGHDGILALDVDGNGKIDNGSEIFSPHFAGGSYATGLAALATLDSNHDGKIDAADEAFSKLTVWQDLNHNGVTDAGELSSLADQHITSIGLNAQASNTSINGQTILSEGSYTTADGGHGSFVEVAFDTTLGGSEDGAHAYSLIGSSGDDLLSGAGGMYTISGGAGADTFVLDTDALKDVKLADVITDYKASEGDTLDVSKLLDTLLGHQATEAEAVASVKTAVSGSDTVVSVNANGGWHDVAVLQNTTEAVKILFDDKHDTTTAPHVG